MKNFIISAVAAGALLSGGAALAADLPARTTAPPPVFSQVPLFSWSGFYVGANAGYSFGSFTGPGGGLVRDPAGFSGGLQVGANYQIDQFVLGAEADWQWTDAKAGPTVAGFGLVNRGRFENFGTLRARAGVAIDRALIYVTGGYAFGNTKVTLIPPGVGGVISDSTFHNGWAVGAGTEYAITNNVTAKVEYLYTSFEKKSLFGGATRAGGDLSTVRGGVNYKF